MLPRNGETTIVNMINVFKRNNAVKIEMEGVISGHRDANEVLIKPLNCIDHKLKFGTSFQKDEPVYLKLTSDFPLRNHLMTRSATGMVSFDHFPN